MQIRLLIIIGLFFIPCGQLMAQVHLDSLPMLGFSCGYSGEQSKPVQKFEELLQSKDFQQLFDILENGNSAEQYLAIVTLQYLADLDIIQLAEPEKDLINERKESRALVAYCYGCTERHWRMLNELFTDEYVSEAKNWLTKQLNKE